MDSRRDDLGSDLSAGQCDTDEDGQWLTYVQLAEKRGVTLRAVMRQAQRQKLRRQPSNDGKTLVWVPRDAVAGGRTGLPAAARSDRAGDVAVAVAALERAHERELAAKDEALASLQTAHERERDLLQERVASAELAARIAQDAAEALRQANAARKAGSRWRRAWDGWRGR